MKALKMAALMTAVSLFLGLQKPQETVLYNTAGLALKKFDINESAVRTTLVVAIIDPAIFQPDIVGMSEEYMDGRSAIEIIRAGQANVVLGSGFVKSFYPMIPSGFLKIDNSVLNPYSMNGYNGIAAVQDNKLSLLPASLAASKQVTDGFQTGPFLVRSNKVVYNTKSPQAGDRYNRAFIAFNKSGKIVAVVTQEPVSLKEIAPFFLNTKIKDLQCPNVLNLSGGGSETLVVKDKTSGKIYSYGGYTDNQSAVIVFR